MSSLSFISFGRYPAWLPVVELWVVHETPSISQEPTDLRHGEFEKGAQAAWLMKINRNDLSEAQLRET